MSDLTDFLLARISEDKRDAREVHDVLACSAMEYGGMTPNTCDCGWPEQVAADCEAKRRIVGMFPHAADGDGWNNAGEEVLTLLALPYADHPDYREEWRP